MSEKSLERRAARATALTAVRHLSSLPLSTVSAILLTRLYVPADVGRFGLLAFLVSLPSLIGDLGLTQALIRQRHDPGDRQLELAASVQLWTALLGTPLALLAVESMTPRLGGSMRGPAALMCIPTIFAWTALRANVLIARRLAFARVAGLDLGQQLAYVALIALFGWKGLGVLGLVLAWTVAQLLRLGVLLSWYPASPARLPWPPALGSMMRTGLPLHLTGVVSAFHANLVSWFAMLLFGPVSTGYLRWSHEMTNRIGTGLVHAIGTVVFPTAALIGDDASRLQLVLGRACRYGALLAGVPMALLAGLAGALVPTVFGAAWSPAIPALRLFAWLMVLAALVIPLDAAVRATRPARTSLVLAVAHLGLELGVALVLARAIGFLSIPVAHLLATVLLIGTLRALLPAEARPAWRENFIVPAFVVATTFAASAALAGMLEPRAALLLGTAAGVAAATLALLVVGRHTVWRDLRSDLARSGLVIRPV